MLKRLIGIGLSLLLLVCAIPAAALDDADDLQRVMAEEWFAPLAAKGYAITDVIPVVDPQNLATPDFDDAAVLPALAEEFIALLEKDGTPAGQVRYWYEDGVGYQAGEVEPEGALRDAVKKYGSYLALVEETCVIETVEPYRVYLLENGKKLSYEQFLYCCSYAKATGTEADYARRSYNQAVTYWEERRYPEDAGVDYTALFTQMIEGDSYFGEGCTIGATARSITTAAITEPDMDYDTLWARAAFREAAVTKDGAVIGIAAFRYCYGEWQLSSSVMDAAKGQRLTEAVEEYGENLLYLCGSIHYLLPGSEPYTVLPFESDSIGDYDQMALSDFVLCQSHHNILREQNAANLGYTPVFDIEDSKAYWAGQQQPSVWLYIGIGAGVVILAAVVWIVVRVRRKAN